eukprot:m.50826 g.50826  ORF g.50826 m.50826 type:complete len:464 (-) comp10689_c0_seq2:2159-3550(-)
MEWKEECRQLLLVLHTFFIASNITYCVSDNTLLSIATHRALDEGQLLSFRIVDEDFDKLIYERGKGNFDKKTQGHYVRDTLVWDWRLGLHSYVTVSLKDTWPNSKVVANIILASFTQKHEGWIDYSVAFQQPLATATVYGIDIKTPAQELQSKLLVDQYGSLWWCRRSFKLLFYAALLLLGCSGVVLILPRNYKYYGGFILLTMGLYIAAQPSWMLRSVYSGVKMGATRVADLVEIPVLETKKNDNISLVTNCTLPMELVMTYKKMTPMVQDRIGNWTNLNPSIHVSFFTDDDCEKFLLEEYGFITVSTFRKIKDGAIRSDYFRVHYLYAKGGIYSDVDMVPLLPLDDIIAKSTCSLYVPEDKDSRLNPTLIIAPARHKVLGLAVEFYARLVQEVSYAYWSWSIVHVFSAIHYKYKKALFTTNLKEKCYDWALYDCFLVLRDNGKEYFKVRGDGYDRHKHKVE